MKQTRIIMGMPVTLNIEGADSSDLKKIFDYFKHVDKVFSTYKNSSEISKLNRSETSVTDLSQEVSEILSLSQKTKDETNGFLTLNETVR